MYDCIGEPGEKKNLYRPNLENNSSALNNFVVEFWVYRSILYFFITRCIKLGNEFLLKYIFVCSVFYKILNKLTPIKYLNINEYFRRYNHIHN